MSFATDGWTAPNHKSYIAITVHLEKDSIPFSILLDIVEVAMSHSGNNLAQVFADVLKDFNIDHKVGPYDFENKVVTYLGFRSWRSHAITRHQTIR